MQLSWLFQTFYTLVLVIPYSNFFIKNTTINNLVCHIACNEDMVMYMQMSILHREHNVTTRYKDILCTEKSNLSGTCNALFLERGDKKLYNHICVGGRIARLICICVCVWFFANVTDPFNISIFMSNKLLRACWIYSFDETDI